VLRRVLESKREEITGDWKKLHNEELHNLYPSPDIIRAFILSKMGCMEHVAYMEEMRSAYKIFAKNLKRRDHSEDLGIDGGIIS